MHAWESIQKTLDYIEENTAEDIDIGELAAIAALSPFYYHRLFTRLVKKPVCEYIKLRRLARAGKTLKGEGNRILDVALDCGFSSHETFTRAFKDAYGMTPSEYRNNPVGLNDFLKPDLLLGYVMIDEGVPLISDGIVLEFNRRALEEPLYFSGISGFVRIENQIPLGEATGVDQPGEIWARFEREYEQKINRKPDGRTLGVSYMGDAPKGSFTYFAGAQVENETEHDGSQRREDGFQLWKVPAQEYVVCSFEAEDFETMVCDALYKAMNYSHSWLKKHGLCENGFMTEHYYPSNSETAYMELWFPI